MNNALVNETSPYLLQHADNPVAWHPWGDEALARARSEDKPILLSIGYSACHWCHVMAHESFADGDTAALMNRLFINIKVDREERPDLDKIYQSAHQLLTNRPGGWPLTMFLTPDDRVPFFSGTYFPPTARYGMLGFKEILERVARFYQQEREEIRQQNGAVLEALNQMQTIPGAVVASEPGPAPLIAGVRELSKIFDPTHGGFGGAPKFPHPINLERLLHHHLLDEQERHALDMVIMSLRQMAEGGIYDQIGGGFCRYAVDAAWQIPHFEKMLYDNGPLLALYSDAWQVTKEELFKKIALETADWAIREMQSPQGGFYSSLDADSEGEEGKFYTWTLDEFQQLLAPDECSAASAHFGLDGQPNFDGKWHLSVQRQLQEVAAITGSTLQDTQDHIARTRDKLLKARDRRIRPGRDEKILCSWNGLMIRGLATAAIRFAREDYLVAAEKALQFIQQTMWRRPRLLATCKDGKAHLNAYLDDYAFLIDAILTMLGAKWSLAHLNFATQLAESLLENFYDRERGGFFFTSHDHEDLIQRRMDFMDDALPAGNGIAALGLIQLGHLINEPRFVEAGERSLRAAWPVLERMPSAHNAMLMALEARCYPARQIILRGADDQIDEWRRSCYREGSIKDRIYAIPLREKGLPQILDQRSTESGVVAYVCEGFHCLPPQHNLQALVNCLKNRKSG